MGTNIESPQILTEPGFANDTIDGDQGEPRQDIYTQSATQNFAIGTLLKYPSLGTKFRYTKNGAVALVKALMCQNAALDDTYLVDQIQTALTQSVGDNEILVLITTGVTLAEDALTDGIMLVNKSTGMGDAYTILASKVGSTDTELRVLLRSPLRTALAATSELTFVKHKNRDVIVYPTTVTGIAVGVPLIAVTINYYCWLQTGGPCPILCDSSSTVEEGEPVGVGATAGTCDTGVTVKERWGRAIYEADSSECALINLDLD